MAVFPTGAQARERAQGNNTLVQQIAIMEVEVLDSIAAGTFTATISNTSTVTIQGTTITGSPMTDNDTAGQNYYISRTKVILLLVKVAVVHISFGK